MSSTHCHIRSRFKQRDCIGRCRDLLSNPLRSGNSMHRALSAHLDCKGASKSNQRFIHLLMYSAVALYSVHQRENPKIFTCSVLAVHWSYFRQYVQRGIHYFHLLCSFIWQSMYISGARVHILAKYMRHYSIRRVTMPVPSVFNEHRLSRHLPLFHLLNPLTRLFLHNDCRSKIALERKRVTYSEVSDEISISVL